MNQLETRKPNFFIVGAAKAGTTALSEYLRDHPSVFVCTPKEPNYFCTDFPRDRPFRDEAKYLQLFEEAGDDILAVGEASTRYLYSTEAARGIHAFAPEAKIIILARNPVELLRSYHMQKLLDRVENVENFAEAWSLVEERKAGRRMPSVCRSPEDLHYDKVGLLSEQIERFRDVFPLGNIRVYLFDDLKSDPGGVYRSALEFLGVPDDGRREFPVVGGKRVYKKRALADFTEDYLRPAARFFSDRLGIRKTGLLDAWVGINTRRGQYPEGGEQMADTLREFYRDEVGRLSALLERDLSHWLRPKAALTK